MKNILFVASECVPFIKTGGLADVVGSLPKYFPKEYFDVRVVIPKYAGIKEQFRNQMQYVTNFYMDLNWRQQYVGIFEMEYEGIKFYFIDNEEHFGGSTPYAGMPWDLENLLTSVKQRFPFYRPSASARTSSTATTGRPVSFRFTCTSVSRQMNSIGESKQS